MRAPITVPRDLVRTVFDHTAIIRTDGPEKVIRTRDGSAPGTNCSSSCPTRDHLTFGECMRSKKLQLNPNLADTGAVKAWDGELHAYREARRQGIQPAGTKMHQIKQAVELSQNMGQAFDAGKSMWDVTTG